MADTQYYGADGEGVYVSSFAGTMIDTYLGWVQNNSGFDLRVLNERIAREENVRNNAISNLSSIVSGYNNRISQAEGSAQDAMNRATEVEEKLNGIEITRTVASDGLYIGIKVNGVTVHTEVIQPITFNGLNQTGKNARYGIVDRDFVNDLKEWVKLCVNDKLPETEGFKADWNKDFKQAEADFQQQIKTQDEKIQGLEVYKELFDTGKKEV